MRNLEGASPADRTPVIAWLMAGGSVIMAWQALSTFKSGSAEWTLAPPLVAPGLIFAAAAVEVRRRFGRWGLAGSWAVGVATSMAVAGPSLLEAMDIGSSPGFQWVPMMVFGVPFAVVAFVIDLLAVRRWFDAACDLPAAIVAMLFATMGTFAIVVILLVLTIPRIG